MTAPTPQRPQPVRPLLIVLVVCALVGTASLVAIVSLLVRDRSDESPAAAPLSPAATTTTEVPIPGLNQASVERGVVKVLRDSYGIEDVREMRCPEGMTVSVGAEYECAATVGGEPKTVLVRVTRVDGTYEVGRPR
ncbi:DUF4333 domain-containing protein [Nocardia sp. NPDC057668]|uniref:DUF4333 domain-containing protein n=1 Tax=Nocardia sp. NPDC057668 TaxID=3346202 RepID=UPI00366DB485